MSKKHKLEVEEEQILEKIHWIRGHKVMLDQDLALLYGIPTKRLNEQVNRNRMRFPEDFMFQVTPNELQILKSQFATSSSHGGARTLPWAFTEHGAIQAANFLNSPRAIQVGLSVVRAFVALRSAHVNYVELEECVRRLADKVDGHDAELSAIVAAIRQLASSSAPGKRRKIGFG